MEGLYHRSLCCPVEPPLGVWAVGLPSTTRPAHLRPGHALCCAVQVDMSPRSQFKDWPLLHAATLFLREGLGCLELGTRSGATADRRAAEQLARQ
jgi:hypothetical protein